VVEAVAEGAMELKVVSAMFFRSVYFASALKLNRRTSLAMELSAGLFFPSLLW